MDEMAAISQWAFSIAFHEWKLLILIQMSQKFVPKGPID